MPPEKELKFELTGFSEIRARLVELKALFLHRQLESNELWDYPDLRLKNSGQMLRLRDEEFAGGKRRTVLTFKSPYPDTNREQTPDALLCKVLLEDETGIQDPTAMRRILSALGLQTSARYQKLREEWSLNSPENNTTLCLDVLPFGYFLEIEGPNPVQTARLLGLNLAQGLSLSYHELNRRKHSMPPTEAERKDAESTPNFIFSADVWRKLRENLAKPLQ